MRPKTLTDFRKLGKKRLAHGGRTARQSRKMFLDRERRDAELAAIADEYRGGAERFRTRLTSLVPLGASCPHEDRGMAEHPRRKNWRSSLSGRGMCPVDAITINCGRYSSRCTYTKYEYQVIVRSCARVRPGFLLYWLADEPMRRIKAPHGYRWDEDATGVRLVSIARPADDYHVDSHDLSECSPRQLAAKLRENALIRRREARERAARERAAKLSAKQEARILRTAEREGATVCVRDSVNIGNCEAGTRSWAKNHGLDASRHYRPSEVLALANGDGRRVALVVSAALRRHRVEMDRGFALLADHR